MFAQIEFQIFGLLVSVISVPYFAVSVCGVLTHCSSTVNLLPYQSMIYSHTSGGLMKSTHL